MEDLKYIKKHYGENFSHLCRRLFPTILEKEGLLKEIISSKFAPTRSLYETVKTQTQQFQAFVYSYAKDIVKAENNKKVDKTPAELMDEAGYILYPECQTEEEIQSFRKYYALNEEICTFFGGRLDTCRVWFAIKKNALELKREDFTAPKREDEYGTSVISIQFTRGEYSTLSIKNRYNESVTNPDATFGNNLDNINEGLTQAFINQYDINLIENTNPKDFKFQPDKFVLANNDKYYRYNIKDEFIHYCENNVIVSNGIVINYEKSGQILMDNYIVDINKKTVKPYNDDEDDSFRESLGEIKDINLSKDKNGNKMILITPEIGEVIEITLGSHNEIIGYKNNNVTEIGDNFLKLNESLKYIEMSKVKKIATDFMPNNKALKEIYLPNVETILSGFLYRNHILERITLPKVKEIGGYFLCFNQKAKDVFIPKAETIRNCFLYHNTDLKNLMLKNVKEIGNNFLSKNVILNHIDLSSVEKIGYEFLYCNRNLIKLSLPSAKVIGQSFMERNDLLEELDMPMIEKIGSMFLSRNSRFNQSMFINENTEESKNEDSVTAR